MRRTTRLGVLGVAIAIAVPMLNTGVGNSAINGFTSFRIKTIRGFEPGLNVIQSGSAAGRIVADAPPGLGAQSKLAYTDDLDSCGATNSCWTVPTFPAPFNRFPGGGDSEMAIGHDGRVYFLDLWVGSNTFMRSRDNGETWDAGTPVSNIPTSDRQWLGVGPVNANGEDTVYIVSQHFGLGWHMMARSDDSGDTWVSQQRVPDGASGYTGPIVADDTGFVAFDYVSGGNAAISLSFNKGSTWTTRSLGSGAWSAPIPSLAQSGSNLHAVWVQNNYTIRYRNSSDKGLTWNGLSSVDISGTGSNIFPWVAARGNKVAIAWYRNETVGSTTTNPNNVPASSVWKVYYSESLDGGNTFSSPVAVTRGVKLGIICTAGLSCNSGRELGDFLNVQIGTDDKTLIAHGSFYESPTGAVLTKQD